MQEVYVSAQFGILRSNLHEPREKEEAFEALFGFAEQGLLDEELLKEFAGIIWGMFAEHKLGSDFFPKLARHYPRSSQAILSRQPAEA